VERIKVDAGGCAHQYQTRQQMGGDEAKYSNDHQSQTYPEMPIAIGERFPHAFAISFDIGITIAAHFTALLSLRIAKGILLLIRR
jgi:hypothetical protein